MFLSREESSEKAPVEAVEKLGNGEKAVQTEDRVDGGDIEDCVVRMRIVGYESARPTDSTVLRSVDLRGLFVADKLANQQILHRSFEKKLGSYLRTAALAHVARRCVLQRVEMRGNVETVPPLY